MPRKIKPGDICSHCKVLEARPNGRCLPCNRKLAQAWDAKNRDRRNAYSKEHIDRMGRKHYNIKQRVSKYGISADEVLALLAKGRCDICGEETSGQIDHCHETGKVRGVLCIGCNTFLGKLEKRKHLLPIVWKYLGYTNE